METVRPINYSGIIAPELFTKAQRLHSGKWRLLVPWLFPITMTIFMWMQNPEVSMSMFGVAFAIGCLFPLLFRRSMERKWRKIHQQSPYLKEPVSCTITPAGIEFASSSASGLVKWSMFTNMKELPDLLLLYQAPNIFNIVPKEFFASSQEWDSARDLIHAQVKQGA